MNFGPHDHRGRQLRHHGPGAGAGHQLLRHRQRLRLEEGRGRHRADRRPLVRAGRRAARRRSSWRPRSTARWATGPTSRGLSAYHIRRACEESLRRLQTDHIDLYQMHHIDRDDAVGGDLAGDGAAGAAGQGALRRQQQLRRLAHRAGAGARPRRATSWAWSREQSLYNLNARTIELEVLPACRDYGLGVIPWSPLGGGLLGGRAAEGQRKAGARRRAHAESASRSTASSSRRTRRSAASWARSRPTWRWPGCCTTRSSPRRSSARARWSSSTAACGRWRSSCRLTTHAAARRDLPRPGRRGAGSLRLVASHVLPPSRSAATSCLPRTAAPAGLTAAVDAAGMLPRSVGALHGHAGR